MLDLNFVSFENRLKLKFEIINHFVLNIISAVQPQRFENSFTRLDENSFCSFVACFGVRVSVTFHLMLCLFIFF